MSNLYISGIRSLIEEDDCVMSIFFLVDRSFIRVCNAFSLIFYDFTAEFVCAKINIKYVRSTLNSENNPTQFMILLICV